MKAKIVILRKKVSPPVPPDLDDLIYLACQGKQRCFAGSPNYFGFVVASRRDRARQFGNIRSAGRKQSRCCLATLLDRLHKFQQVGVDFILVRGSEAVGSARIINFLRAFY
jgi:hypothetical protein